MGEERIIMKSQ